MKSRIIVGSLLAMLVVASSTIMAPIVNATPLEPDWFGGQPLIKKSTHPYSISECVNEMRQIKTNNSYYYKEEDKHPKSWCIYHYKDYDITFYKRWFSSVIIDASDVLALYPREESGMAISFDGGELVPVDNIDYSLVNHLVYVPNSDKPLIRTNCEYIGCALSFYDFKHHISLDPVSASQAYAYAAPDGEWSLKYEDGELIRGEGIASSENGAWISFIIPNVGLTRMNGTTHQWEIVDVGYTYASGTDAQTGITDDGGVVMRVASSGEPRAVKYVSGCATWIPSRLDMTGGYRASLRTGCTYIVMSQAFLMLDRPVPGYLSISYFHLSGDGSRAILQQAITNEWYEVYPYNSPANSGMIYLALGDSFTSGEGDMVENDASHYLPGTNMLGDHESGIPRELCHISNRSYPFLLAKDMNVTRGNDMQSVACSGAVRNDIYATSSSLAYLGQPVLQFNGATLPRLQGLSNITSLQESAVQNFIPGRVRQIEMLKTYKPQVATIGVSGNDLNFANVLVECMLNLPIEDTCNYAQGEGLKSLGSAIQSNYQKQVDLYKSLKQASPGTDIYAVGYPQFLNRDAIFCWEIGNALTQKERSMIRYAVSFTNQTIKNAASAAGIKYIDIENAISSNGGDMCADGKMITSPIDKLFSDAMTKVINRYEDGYETSDGYPIRLDFIQDIKNTGRNINEGVYVNALALVMQEASHPNALAHQAMYNYIHMHQIGTSLLNDQCDGAVIVCPESANAVVPHIPEYFGVTDIHAEFMNFVRVDDGTGQKYIQETGLTSVERGRLLQVIADESLLDPDSLADVVIRSDPHTIGHVSVGESGAFDATITLPSDMPVGHHLISIEGKTKSGESIRYLQTVFVMGAKGDLDGDGTVDAVDRCQFVTPAGNDSDNDGVDDNCDLQNNISTSGAISVNSAANSGVIHVSDVVKPINAIDWSAMGPRASSSSPPRAPTLNLKGLAKSTSEVNRADAINNLNILLWTASCSVVLVGIIWLFGKKDK